MFNGRTLELVPRARFDTFEAKVKESALENGYQCEDMFVLKITQLREIFEVRRPAAKYGLPNIDFPPTRRP